MTIPIVDVDYFGNTADGDNVNNHASADMVREGYMQNVKVIARYPNGKQKIGNLIRVTAPGLQFLKRTIPLSMRNTEGTS